MDYFAFMSSMVREQFGGKTLILEQGIHSGVPIEHYIRDPAPEPSLSTGAARLLLEQCPKRAWFEHPRLNPDWKSKDGSKESDIGSIAHDVLLEGSEKRLVMVDADDWRTKFAREARDMARAEGKIAILARKWPEIQAMVAVAKHALIKLGPKQDPFEVEQTLVWQDGAWLRSRPDILSFDYRIAIDYKTTSVCADPNAFARQIIAMGYDLQAALIRSGVFALRGVTPDVVFLVQETEPPYLCSFVGLSPMFMEMAEKKLQTAISRWKASMESGHWPGYPEQVAWVDPPAWAMTRAEELM